MAAAEREARAERGRGTPAGDMADAIESQLRGPAVLEHGRATSDLEAARADARRRSLQGKGSYRRHWLKW